MGPQPVFLISRLGSIRCKAQAMPGAISDKSRRAQRVDISPKRAVGSVLPSGGNTNTRRQNTRSSHLSSGMCEWRGHHCAKSSSGAGQDVRAVVAGQYGDLHALTRRPRTAVAYRTVLMHVQPRECESQLVCGRTTQTWASFQEQRWGIVGASGGVALGRIPLAKRSR